MEKPKPFLPGSGELKKSTCDFPLALTNLPKAPHSAPDSEIISVKPAQGGKYGTVMVERRRSV